MTEEIKLPMYVTVEKACEILNIGRDKLYRLVDKGTIRAKDLNSLTGKRRQLRIWSADLLPEKATE